MIKTLAGSFLALAIVGVSSFAVADTTLSPSPLDGNNQDFTIWNATDFEIGELHVSLSSNPRWGEDILGEDILPAGNHTHISFHGYKPSDCMFDMRIRKGNGGKFYDVASVNLCEIDDVAFTNDGDRVTFHKK